MTDRDNPTPVELVHEHYLNHLVGCRGCWAPTKRYCGTGLTLRVDYDAHYLLSLPDLYQRRAMLAREDSMNLELANAIRTRATELFEEGKAQAQ